MFKVKRDTADKYFSLFIRKRDGWKCERKGDKVVDQLILASNQYYKKDRKPIADYYRLKNKE